jgi:signal peptidase II
MVSDLLRKRPALKHALPAALAAAFVVVLIDQLSKQLVVESLNLRRIGEIAVAPGLNFRMAWNTGVNFGLLSGGGDLARWILMGGTSLVAIILLASSLACRRTISAVGLGIAAGGAVGNTIDRLNWGAVADFLNVSCCGIDNPWSFNIADIAIFVGFGLLLLPLRRQAAPAPSSGEASHG